MDFKVPCRPDLGDDGAYNTQSGKNDKRDEDVPLSGYVNDKMVCLLSARAFVYKDLPEQTED